MALLAARARQAFLEFNPMRGSTDDPERIYRTVPFGPLVDIFALDLRSYRGGNSSNRQPALTRSRRSSAPRSSRRSKARLAASRATWKVMATDLPLALIVGDGADRFEAFANGDAGPPLGRELEIAELLRFIRDRRIDNVVWITGDVHYCAAHHYHPSRARFTEFDSVLGIRRRAAARRHVRAQHARSDVRARGALPRHPDGDEAATGRRARAISSSGGWSSRRPPARCAPACTTAAGARFSATTIAPAAR